MLGSTSASSWDLDIKVTLVVVTPARLTTKVFGGSWTSEFSFTLHFCFSLLHLI